MATLTADQRDSLRGRLEDERARILRVLQGTTPTAPSRDEEAEPEEVAQRATEVADQLGVADRERALLDEVERALGKLGAGTYGLAESTGKPIPLARLAAVPWARE
jgi:DnaK suppressor protein